MRATARELASDIHQKARAICGSRPLWLAEMSIGTSLPSDSAAVARLGPVDAIQASSRGWERAESLRDARREPTARRRHPRSRGHRRLDGLTWLGFGDVPEPPCGLSVCPPRRVGVRVATLSRADEHTENDRRTVHLATSTDSRSHHLDGCGEATPAFPAIPPPDQWAEARPLGTAASRASLPRSRPSNSLLVEP